MNQQNSNTVWAVGRNYLDHAKEMNSQPASEPVIFIKPMACIDPASTISLPDFSQQIDYELEVALRLNDDLKIEQIALALDLTARDHQQKAKSSGLPWALAKSFRGALKLSPWVDFIDPRWFDSLTFDLKINEQRVQMGQTSDMIFKCDDILSYLKKHFPLQPQDIVLTGTPAGVGPLSKGDKLLAGIPDLINWPLTVV